MAKIGVYVPDDRMKDIERWRDKMNFSQLFMEAFDRAVVAQADLAKVKGKEMKAVVERLKHEADGTFERGWKAGAKDGREWALKCAYLSHLRQIGEGELTFSNPKNDVISFLRHYYERHGYIETEDDEYKRHWDEKTFDFDTFQLGFNRGFVEAVQHVWEDIKDAF